MFLAFPALELKHVFLAVMLRRTFKLVSTVFVDRERKAADGVEGWVLACPVLTCGFDVHRKLEDTLHEPQLL